MLNLVDVEKRVTFLTTKITALEVKVAELEALVMAQVDDTDVADGEAAVVREADEALLKKLDGEEGPKKSKGKHRR